MAEIADKQDSIVSEFIKFTIQDDLNRFFIPYLPFKIINRANEGDQIESEFYLEILKLLKIENKNYSVFAGIDAFYPNQMCDACVFYKDKQYLIEIKSENREKKHPKVSSGQLQNFVDFFGRTQEITAMVFSKIVKNDCFNIIDFLENNCKKKNVQLPEKIRTREEIEESLMKQIFDYTKCKTLDDAFDKLLIDRTYNMVRNTIKVIENKKHCILAGPAGSGKTYTLIRFFKETIKKAINEKRLFIVCGPPAFIHNIEEYQDEKFLQYRFSRSKKQQENTLYSYANETGSGGYEINEKKLKFGNSSEKKIEIIRLFASNSELKSCFDGKKNMIDDNPNKFKNLIITSDSTNPINLLDKLKQFTDLVTNRKIVVLFDDSMSCLNQKNRPNQSVSFPADNISYFVMSIDLYQFYCININKNDYGLREIIPNFKLNLNIIFLEDIWRYSRKVHNFIEKFYNYLLSVQRNLDLENLNHEFKCFWCFYSKILTSSNNISPRNIDDQNSGDSQINLNDNFINLWKKLTNSSSKFKFGFRKLYGDHQDGIVQISKYESENDLKKKLNEFNKLFGDDFHIIIDGNVHLNGHKQEHENIRKIIHDIKIKYNDLYCIEEIKADKNYSRKLYSKEFKRLVYIFPHDIKILAHKGEIWRLDCYFGMSRATIGLYILYKPCENCSKNLTEKTIDL
ncbi:hypothetical protein BpHYR1_024406 [Brachionus plicatilis]|uniref:Helicase/UvrB N-terminal domain-containing protein n=1 Tax=Brachionus plicatilis TaxID=10195 RepID=A0A3M7QVS9_BRAPC|nr:hypothetical protein BpHYR1_024406 [Brachionus plicatilis]